MAMTANDVRVKRDVCNAASVPCSCFWNASTTKAKKNSIAFETASVFSHLMLCWLLLAALFCCYCCCCRCCARVFFWCIFVVYFAFIFFSTSRRLSSSAPFEASTEYLWSHQNRMIIVICVIMLGTQKRSLVAFLLYDLHQTHAYHFFHFIFFLFSMHSTAVWSVDCSCVCGQCTDRTDCRFSLHIYTDINATKNVSTAPTHHHKAQSHRWWLWTIWSAIEHAYSIRTGERGHRIVATLYNTHWIQFGWGCGCYCLFQNRRSTRL